MFKRVLFAITLGLWLLVPAARSSATDTAEHAAHAAGGAAAHDAEAGEHAKPPLLPDPSDHDTQMHALWVLIIFVVLLAILYPTAWKNVLTGLKKREERIRKDIADAEAARAKAEATLRDYNTRLATAENKVRELLNNAVQDGEKLAASIRIRAQEEAEESKQRAVREIEASKHQALAEIYERAADLSTSIAEKILRRAINADDQRDLVRSSLDQLQDVAP